MAYISDPIREDYRVSAGGITLQSHWFGPAARRRSFISQPVNRRSQIAVSKLSSLWRGLPSETKIFWSYFSDSWPVLNRYGKSIYLTSWLWFKRLNLQRLISGLSINEIPPENPYPTYSVSFISVFTGSPGDLFASISPDPSPGEIVSFSYKLNIPIFPFVPPNPAQSGPTFIYPSASPFLVLPSGSYKTGQGFLTLGVRGFDSFGRASSLNWFTVPQ